VRTTWFTEQLTSGSRSRRIGKSALLGLGCAGASFGVVAAAGSVIASGGITLAVGLATKALVGGGKSYLINRAKRDMNRVNVALGSVVESATPGVDPYQTSELLSSKILIDLDTYVNGEQRQNRREATKLIGIVAVSAVAGAAGRGLLNIRNGSATVKEAAQFVTEKSTKIKSAKQAVNSTLSPKTPTSSITSTLAPNSAPNPTAVDFNAGIVKPNLGPFMPSPKVSDVLTIDKPVGMIGANTVDVSNLSLSPASGKGTLSMMHRFAHEINPGKKISDQEIFNRYMANRSFWDKQAFVTENGTSATKYMKNIKGYGLIKGTKLRIVQDAASKLKFA
jgi:hypothetical protein